MRGAWCESESVAEAAASPQTRRALSPPLPSTPREHTKVRTQLAIFTGPAPSAPRYRAVVVSCSATRLPGGGRFCVCPAHFHCPPKVSARINAHIPASPSLPRHTFSFFLSSLATYARRAFFIAPRLMVAREFVDFAPATTMPRARRAGRAGPSRPDGRGGRGGRETRRWRQRQRRWRRRPPPPPLPSIALLPVCVDLRAARTPRACEPRRSVHIQIHLCASSAISSRGNTCFSRTFFFFDPRRAM